MNAKHTYKETCEVIYSNLPKNVRDKIEEAKSKGKFNIVVPIIIDKDRVDNY